MDLGNVLLYSTSTAAQVWAAILVFHILLVRDQKAAVLRETDELWAQARHWWGTLIQSLHNVNVPNLGANLAQTGLDRPTIDRAETDRTCFKKLMNEVHERRLVQTANITTHFGSRQVNAASLQTILDVIAERLKKLEKIELEPKVALVIGISAIVLNLAILMALGFLIEHLSKESLVGLTAAVNVIGIGVFSFQTWKSFGFDT